MFLPSIHQRVWLLFPGLAEERHPVRVRDIENSQVVVELPREPEALQALEQRRPMLLQFLAPEGHVQYQVQPIAREADAVRLQVVESRWTQKREYLRWQVDLPVRLRGPERGEAGWWRARLVDIGGGGVGLLSGRQLDPGTALEVQIRLPTGPVDAVAEVVTCRQEGPHFRLGLRFTRITDAARSRIVRFVFQEELRSRRPAGRNDDAER